MSKPNVLARLFGRSQSPLVAQLFSQAVGQPLMVHPQMGESLLGAYLNGAIETRPATLTVGEITPGLPAANGMDPVPGRRVAVLNISGVLVNRFEPGLCDPGPLSYSELRAAFDTAMADPSLEAIVMRIESPGGMASGLMDLVDHVVAQRGTKPIYASVDDYAYSAAYALASAADEVWVTRSSGAGSIGVIAYHVDQSGWNAKKGLKVTAIYSGAHKNDFSPHEQLSESTLQWLQEHIDKGRQDFAATVARNRGMEIEAVLATEAGVYFGADAIAAGLADRMGTFYDLLQHIAAGNELDGEDEEEEEEIDEPTAAQVAAASDPAAAEGAVVVDAEPAVAADEAEAAQAITEATAKGLVAAAILAADLNAALTKALLKNTALTPATVEARIAEAQAIDDACAAAGLRECAAAYVEKGTSLEKVRADLSAAVVDPGPEISTHLPVPGAEKPAAVSRLSPTAIYQKRGKRNDRKD